MASWQELYREHGHELPLDQWATLVGTIGAEFDPMGHLEELVGGPLEVKEFAKIPTANGPGTYDSICTYVAKGGNFENAVTAPRVLDLTLHFLHSADETKKIYEGSIEQYRQMAKAPDAPFKNATITPIDGFGDKAFALEAVTDPKTGYKSALIVFYKGRVGGSVGA